MFRAGNSLVVSLPRDMVAGLGLEEGAPVAVEFDQDRHRLTIQPVEIGGGRGGGAGYARMVEDFIDKYEDVLKELAR